MAKVEVEVTADNTKKVFKALNLIQKSGVYVGIPESKAARENAEEDNTITNAQLLFIHTNGSPVNNIPARPVIEPAIRNDKERLNKMLEKAALLALEGDEQGFKRQMELTGMRGQNVSRAWFTNPQNNWPPNSPSVQARKRRKGSTDPKPLIDTGELRKSITYVVEINGVTKK